jgi:hypothetical protein
MNRSRRFKQNVAIFLGILVVVLLLWHLRSRPVGMGGAVATNVFGPVTLNMLSGETGGGEASNAPTVTNVLAPSHTNTVIQRPTNAPSNIAPTHPQQTLSTNLLNTNGPVTTIDVPSADLLATPPDVTVASTSPEATTIEERLGAASAQGGEIQISLSWNDYNDLDLHCIDPRGEEIWFNNRRSRSGGTLDIDQNAHFPFTTTPVENIYWPIGGAPTGRYKIFVVFYSPHAQTMKSAFTVRTAVRNWKTYFFKSVIDFPNHQEAKYVCTLQYDPTNTDPDKRYRFVR